MTLGKFLTLAATIIGFVGTIYLLKGVLRMSPNVIGEISQSRYGFSSPVIVNLSTQKADTICGFILIAIAFIFQLLKEFLGLEKIELPGSYGESILIILFLCTAINLVAIYINYSLRRHNRIEAGKALTKRYIDKNILDATGIKKQGIKDIEPYATRLLFLPRGENEADEVYIVRIGDYLGLDLRSKLSNKKE